MDKILHYSSLVNVFFMSDFNVFSNLFQLSYHTKCRYIYFIYQGQKLVYFRIRPLESPQILFDESLHRCYT